MTVPFTRAIGGQPVTVRALASQQALADDVLDAIERLPETSPLRTGLRIRFGWSMLTFRERDAGWIVCEPDFDGDPLRDVRPEIVTTLEVAGRQAAFARELGFQPVDVTFDQYMVVAPGAMRAREVQLFREAGTAPDDSGWSLTASDASASSSDTQYDAIHLYTLLRDRPAILPVLVLPPGYAVLFDGERVGLVLDPEGNAYRGDGSA